jgi:hypothetical protein
MEIRLLFVSKVHHPDTTELILKIGRIIAIAINPTIPPIKIIIAGSSKLVNVFIAS